MERLRPEDGAAAQTEVLAMLPAFWGTRDMRALHHPMWWRQFAGDAVLARRDGVLAGYLLGTVTAHHLGYVHIVATHHEHRGRGVGRLLYETFLAAARASGAVSAEAMTSVDNTGSIAFHRRLGFSDEVVADYSGPGEDRVSFRLPLLNRHYPVDVGDPAPPGAFGSAS